MTLPTGTVTFLRTDVEGSMRHARALGADWDAVNDRHIALLRRAVTDRGGSIVRTEGDAVFAVFPEAVAAVNAAADAQRALSAEPWPGSDPIRVRMGLHSGEAHLAGDDYGGFDVNRAARVAAVGHGGQIVLSETTTALVEDALPEGTALRDLGRHLLRDVPRAERLHQLDVAGLPTAFAPLRTNAARDGNLPDRVTSFRGRDRELAELVDLVAVARLVTLTGPGGIGKSSLAIEAARALADDFPDGAWFISLAAIDDPGQVMAAVARGIGVFDGPERTAAAALPQYLADRSAILVLDNMEQVLGAAGDVASLMRGSPGTRFIVTSRAPLHVAGEREVPVGPVSDAAVAIFTDRARAVRPGWEPGGDMPVVSEICALLDDLPLGIEIAAARVANLPAPVIRDRLTARLPLPGPAARDAPDRQRTLEAAVAWSHDLLEPDLQRLLQELSVFEDSFDLEQVDAMSASAGEGTDRLDDVLELADRSLVVAVADPGGRARFRLLRTIQTYALARLAADGREASARRRHAEAILALLEEQAPGLGTSRQPAVLDRVGPDIDNLRSAQRWTITGHEPELALWLAARLWRFWNAFGIGAEGRQLTEAALAMPGAEEVTLARAWAASALGSLAYWQADSDAARTWYEHQIEIATAVGDEACIVDGKFNLGHVIFIAPEDEPLRLTELEDVVRRYHALGDSRGESRAAWSRGILAMGDGRPEEAAAFMRRAMAEADKHDDRQYHAMSVASLGWAAFAMGDVATAIQMAIEGLLESHAMRDVATTTISLHVGVLAAAALGRFEDAAELIGAFEAGCERYGVRPPAALTTFIEMEDPFAATRNVLPPDVFEAAHERGQRLELDEAVAKVAELGETVGASPEVSLASPQ
ncbi:MAG: ATP-binding protein [Chloroflexota bacterium]